MKLDKKLKITFLITERAIGGKITDYLKSKGIEDYFLFYGKGSASTAILDYLGIGESERDVILYPSSEENAVAIIENIKDSEYLKNTIIFRIPVKGISSISALNHFLKEDK